MNFLNLGIEKLNREVSEEKRILINKIGPEFKWALILSIISLLFVLWFPFGFSLTGLIEEWGILNLFKNYELLFIANSDSAMSVHSLRPLTVLPHAIAYWLDPNSFHYWHMLTILSFIIKGISISFLIWEITKSKYWTILAGLLILIYPADTMQLSFRALHINWSLSLLLLSSALFIAAIRINEKFNRYLITLTSASLLWVSIAMYEASLALIGLPFFILYIQNGARKSLAIFIARKRFIAIWLISIVLYLIYVVVVSSKIVSYQKSLMGNQSILSITLNTYPKLFSPGLLRSLIGGWFDAIRIFLKEIGFLGYVYLFTSILLIVSLVNYLLKNELHWTKEPSVKSIILVRLVIVGVFLILLGYLPYLASNSHLLISQRTFLFIAPGAVMFWIGLLMLFQKWKKKLAFLCSILMLTMGLSFQLFQFHHYLELSERQCIILRQIVAQVDNKLLPKHLIILDENNQLNHTWMLFQDILQAALGYFFETHINLDVCHMPQKTWVTSKDPFKRAGKCIEEKDKWVFREPPSVTGPNYLYSKVEEDKIILKKDAIVVGVKATNSKLLSNLKNKEDSHLHNIENKRYQGILMPSAWTEYFNRLWRIDLSKYAWSFGNWWSMELPVRGSGWQEASWTVRQFYHTASSWKTQENASLLFDLNPKKQPYILKGRFEHILNERVRNSIQIFVNNHPILLELDEKGEFKAEIPFNFLLAGANTLIFQSVTVPDYYGLSLSLASVEIFPGRQLEVTRSLSKGLSVFRW